MNEEERKKKLGEKLREMKDGRKQYNEYKNNRIKNQVPFYANLTKVRPYLQTVIQVMRESMDQVQFIPFTYDKCVLHYFDVQNEIYNGSHLLNVLYKKNIYQYLGNYLNNQNNMYSIVTLYAFANISHKLLVTLTTNLNNLDKDFSLHELPKLCSAMFTTCDEHYLNNSQEHNIIAAYIQCSSNLLYTHPVRVDGKTTTQQIYRPIDVVRLILEAIEINKANVALNEYLTSRKVNLNTKESAAKPDYATNPFVTALIAATKGNDDVIYKMIACIRQDKNKLQRNGAVATINYAASLSLINN
jgi:hypothetical protein